MKYVIGDLQWKLPRAPYPLIRLCWPFEGNHNAYKGLSDNEFGTPGIELLEISQQK